MKLSFSTLGCPDWSFSEMLSVAADLGYAGIELRGIAEEIYAPKIPQFQPNALKKTAERLVKLGVEIPVLTTGAYLIKNPDIESAEFEVKDYVMLAKKLADEMKKTSENRTVRTPYVRVLAERGPESEGITAEERAGALERLKALCSFAAGFGVELLVETNGFLADSNELRTFMLELREAGAENCGVIWDLNHTYRFYGETPKYTLGNIAEFVKHVHIKDSVRGRNGAISYMLCGYGDIPIDEAVNELKAIGYDGFFSYEWVKRWSKELAEPGVAFYSYANYMKMLG